MEDLHEAYRYPEGMDSLTPFQKKKVEHLYKTFYDVNGDGLVDWNDFKVAIEKISGLNGWDDKNEKKQHALENLELIWKSLEKKADTNKDGHVSHEEWLDLWGKCAENVCCKQEFPYWLSGYMSLMFDAADTSGDNIIDKQEYQKAYKEFGITEEQSAAAFDKFTDNGSKQLNRELYSQLWHQYLLSDNPEDKGNSLFGKSDW